jgi:DNA (cytosine-5)-methyltransferase 1
MKRLTCVDLFCGCGCFRLGMERAGFTVLAAIDSNPEAAKVIRKNLPDVAHCEIIPNEQVLHGVSY